MATIQKSLVLSSFKYANNEPVAVLDKSFEKGTGWFTEELDKIPLSDTLEEIEEKKPTEVSLLGENGWSDDEEEETENDPNRAKNDENDDDIEWSGDEAELSREISILEQSISLKREHSPTKSPRKRSK